MATTERNRRRDRQRAPRPSRSAAFRVLWFITLYIASLAAVSAIAYALRLGGSA